MIRVALLVALLIALLISATVNAGTRPLTATELQTLHASVPDRQGRGPAWSAASKLVLKLAAEGNIEVVAAIVEIRDWLLLNQYINAYHPGRVVPDPRIDALALRTVRDPSYINDPDGRETLQQLFQLIGPNYRSRELFDWLYQWRKSALERGVEPPLSYFSLLPLDIPGIEAPLTALLPLQPNACEALPYAQFLQKRGHVSRAFEPLRDVYLRAPVSRAHCGSMIGAMLAELRIAAAYEAVAQRVRRLAALPGGPDRDQELLEAISLLGAAPPDSQVDLAVLAREVLRRPMAPDLHARLDQDFQAQIALAARAQEPKSENLYFWFDRERFDIITALLDRGADANAIGPRDLPLLSHALMRGAGDCPPPAGTFIERHYDNPELQEARHQLKEATDDELVASLLAHGALVARPDGDGLLPMHRAARAGNVRAMALLLEHGADVNARIGGSRRTDTGSTPLHEAMYCHRADAVGFLLDHHADVNARLADGSTALMLAIAGRDAALARLLVDRGADVRLGVGEDLTPILVAHEAGLADTEKLLRSKGALLSPITVAKRALMRKYFEWMFRGGMN